MEDFFKQFKKNWENRPEPPFDEKDWQALQKNLVGASPKRRHSGLGWWKFGAPLVLLLAASNLAFFWEARDLRQALNTYEKQRDTVWLSCVEYHTDTITIFRDRPAGERVSSFWPQSLAASSAFANLELPLKKSDTADIKTEGQPIAASSATLPSISNTKQPAGIAGLQNQSEIRDIWNALLPLPLPVGFLKETETLELETTLKPIAPAVRKKSLKQSLYALRPRDFVAGIEGAWSYPIQKGLHAQSGYAAGIRASIAFSPHFRVWGDADYSNIHFSTDRMGEDIGVPFVQPPSDDFDFLEAEVNLPSLQFGLGVEYHFRTASRLRPILGIGIGKIYRTPYDIIYDFAKVSEGLEWSIDKPINPQGPAPGFWVAHGGFDYKVFGRWHWQLMASYQKSLNKGVLYFPQILNLQTGLNYHF